LQQRVVGRGDEEGRAFLCECLGDGGAGPFLRRHRGPRFAADIGLKAGQVVQQVGPVDRDHDAPDRGRSHERGDNPLDHGRAADLDQRLVAHAGVVGQRVAAGPCAGEHQRG
jgi:hypothetical protein